MPTRKEGPPSSARAPVAQAKNAAPSRIASRRSFNAGKAYVSWQRVPSDSCQMLAKSLNRGEWYGLARRLGRPSRRPSSSLRRDYAFRRSFDTSAKASRELGDDAVREQIREVKNVVVDGVVRGDVRGPVALQPRDRLLRRQLEMSPHLLLQSRRLPEPRVEGREDARDRIRILLPARLRRRKL